MSRSRSSQSIWVLGVIKAAARMSPSRNTLSTISLSASSKVPMRVPSAIMIFISSSVTPVSVGFLTPTALSANSVETLSSFTIGINIFDKRRIGRATAIAIGSGLLSAILFGTNSPTISETYVMAETTSAILTVPAYGPTTGKGFRYTTNPCAIVTPPYAPVKMPIRVMPT